MEGLKRIFVRGGALEAFLEARDIRLIKYIGIRVVDKDVGVIAIKAIAKRRWTGERSMIGDRPFTTWYEPFEDQEDIDLAVWYTLSQRGVATYSMAAEVRLWDKIISAGERFRRLSEEKQLEVIERFRAKSTSPLFPER